MRTPVFLLLALTLSSCSGTDDTSARPAPPAEERPAADIASSDPLIQFFHEQLVANGEDIQSDFGSYLTTLDLNARDLQQDDPKHAYDTVLDKVEKIGDPALRRDMMRTFFNRTVDAP